MKKFYKLFSAPEKAKRFVKNVALGFGVLIGSYQSIDAQVNTYSFTQSNGTYSPITGTVLGTATGNTGTTSLNSDIFPVAIPFGFVFNGSSYNSLNVSSNGFITFGATPPAATTLTPISGTVAYDGAISAFGRDLNSVFNVAGVTGNISWDVVGAAPNREMVIQWKDFRPSYSIVTSSVYTFSFQIRLQETTNVIKTVYSSGSYLIGSTSYASTAQIGLRGTSAADYNNRLNATTLEFFNSTSGTANNSAQNFSTTNAVPGMPPAGLTYSWAPPTCWKPSAVTNPSSTVNSVNVQWVSANVVPANGYEIYYSTTNTDPIASTAALITGINSTSAVISGLADTTTYYVWVRSVCGGTDKSEWTAAGIAKTLCPPMTSMFENFDSYATGNIVPECWARILGASSTAQTISSASPASGTRHISQIATSAANASIVVLPEFSNVNAGTHWLRFKARVASATGSLDVGYVTNIANAATFVNLQTITILNTSYTAQDAEYTVVVPNTIPSNARLAIRNSGTSAIANFYDDVYWEVKASCIAPFNITVSNITPTSAQLQWSASSTPAANGYDIYYSTTNTAPTASATPSMTVTTGTSTIISPLQPSTRYYVWVRSRCSATDFSAWSTQIVTFTTFCQPPVITATTGATVCPNNPATLSATASTGVNLTWYDAATNGSIVGTGTSFTTPVLNSTTNYYVSASTGGMATVGKTAIESSATNGGSIAAYLEFTALSDFTLNTVDLFPYSSIAGTPGTVTIELRTSTGVPITSTTVNVTGRSSVATSVPQTVVLNFPIAAGASYRLGVSGWSGITNMYRDDGISGNITYPYSVPGAVDITGAYLGPTSVYYYFFYNWKILTGCESPKTMVTATVDSACLGTSETDKKNNIKVYPNPFSDIINIDRPELVKSMQILDLSGKLIRNNLKPESVVRLNDLSSGMYILQLDMKDGSKQTVKIIKK